MANNKIKKIKQDLFWNHVFCTLDDLYSGYYFDDKKFNEMLHELLMYVDNKLFPPNEQGEVVNRYVIVEYK